MREPNILVGYVEAFSFTNPQFSESLLGHPKVGRIYRVFETDGNYLIHIGAANTAGKVEGIALGETLVGNYEDKWSFNVIPITKDNFTDYPIQEEDLKNLLEWFETDNADLRRLLGLHITPVDLAKKIAKEEPPKEMEAKFYDETGKEISPPTPKELERIHKILNKAADTGLREKRIRIIGEISDSLNFLMDTDPVLVEVLNDLFGHLADTYTDKYEDENVPNISKEIQYSASLGKGANIYSAIKHIQAYSTVGYEGSEQVGSLLAAIHYCLFELQRRKIHE